MVVALAYCGCFSSCLCWRSRTTPSRDRLVGPGHSDIELSSLQRPQRAALRDSRVPPAPAYSATVLPGERILASTPMRAHLVASPVYQVALALDPVPRNWNRRHRHRRGRNSRARRSARRAEERQAQQQLAQATAGSGTAPRRPRNPPQIPIRRRLPSHVLHHVNNARLRANQEAAARLSPTSVVFANDADHNLIAEFTQHPASLHRDRRVSTSDRSSEPSPRTVPVDIMRKPIPAHIEAALVDTGNITGA